MPDDHIYELDARCKDYEIKVPTMQMLFKDAPPEYWPLLALALPFLGLNTLVWVLELRKHSAYLNGKTLRLAARTCAMLSCFWVFCLTSSLGLLSMRSTVYLHFIANTYEAFCLLCFYDMMVIHLNTEGFLNGTETLELSTPPCCCCLPLPAIKSTGINIRRLRILIFQMIVFQTFMEVMHVLMVFECVYDPDSIKVNIGSALVGLSFTVAVWPLLIVFKAGRAKSNLGKYSYVLKFIGFKVLIFISKILKQILAKVASIGRIEPFANTGPKARVSCWSNFLTVIASTLMLLLVRNLYNHQDYEPLLKKRAYSAPKVEHADVIQNGALAIKIEENGD